MSVIDKQIHGSNLCNNDCLENDSIIHPETCVGQVLINDDGSTSIEDWVGNNAGGSFTSYNSLLEWLRANYNIEYTLPTASDSILGGVKIGDYLSINDGILSVDISSLNIPASISTATFGTLGTIKLGNSAVISSNFSAMPATDTDAYYFPVRLDGNSRAGIAIEKSLFDTGVQPNWNTQDSQDPSFILNKPNIKAVATSGSYNDLSDLPSIPSKVSDLDNDLGFIESDSLSSVAFSGDYNDLKNTPDYATVMHYKGSVSTYNDLPTTNLTIGDVYNVTSTGVNYAWDGATWDALGASVLIDTLSPSNHQSGTGYLVNGSGNDTNKFLKGDGTWSAPTDTKYTQGTGINITNSNVINLNPESDVMFIELGDNTTFNDIESYSLAIANKIKNYNYHPVVYINYTFTNTNDSNISNGTSLAQLIETLYTNIKDNVVSDCKVTLFIDDDISHRTTISPANIEKFIRLRGTVIVDSQSYNCIPEVSLNTNTISFPKGAVTKLDVLNNKTTNKFYIIASVYA